MIKLLDEQFDKNTYNGVAAHPMQSWEWGAVRESMALEVVRVGVFANETLQDVYQMTLHPIPKSNKLIGYVPRSNFPNKEVLDFFYTYAKERGIAHIKFEPNELKRDVSEGRLAAHAKLKRSPFELFTPWQFLLDLSPSEEDLLKNMKSKTRYNIRLADRKGVEVKEVTGQEGFEQFADLYVGTTKRQSYGGRSKAYLQKVWDQLGGKMAHVLVASYEGEPLAAYMLFLFNDVLYYPYGGSSDKHRKLMPANLLMWEAIKFGKKHNAKLFDMWGALGPGYDTKHPRAGFTRFKEGYGGEHVEFAGSYDLVVSPFWYWVYKIGMKVRKIRK